MSDDGGMEHAYTHDPPDDAARLRLERDEARAEWERDAARTDATTLRADLAIERQAHEQRVLASAARIAAVESALRDVLGALRTALGFAPGCDDHDCDERATHEVGFAVADDEADDGMFLHGRMCEAHASRWVAAKPGRIMRRMEWAAHRLDAVRATEMRARAVLEGR